MSKPLRRALSRRKFVEGAAVSAGTAGLAISKGWARDDRADVQTLSGTQFDLTVGSTQVNFTGRSRTATTVNNTVPAPLLRFREGDTVTLNVRNTLREPSSIHWHGLLLPNGMDGVPGLTFRGIMPGETFTYRFPVRQSGTYWYHSHSGMQEQTGLYGPLILEPRAREPYSWQREFVVMLSDWTDEDPMTVVSNLKQQGDYYNTHRRTLGTFIKDAKRDGLSATVEDRLMWGQMRMSPTDIMDVTGATYTFLMNGQPPAANWTGLFALGEKVRLRFINGSSMSTFDVRIPGLAMTVVQADGSDVQPVEVDEFRIGVAETYDVIVAPRQNAYTIFAQAQDRSGYARGTLATRPGLSAEIPPMDPVPMRTMADMGMSHGDMNMPGMDMSKMSPAEMEKHKAMGHAVPSAPAAPPPSPAMNGMDMSKMSPAEMEKHKAMGHAVPSAPGAPAPAPAMKGMDMSKMSAAEMERHKAMGHAMPSAPAAPAPAPAMMGMSHDQMPGMQMPAPSDIPTTNADGVDPMSLRGKPSVDNVAMVTKNRLAEPGVGLENNGRRVLTYHDLRSIKERLAVPPTRAIEFHLTGNMERWVWGFNGKKFSEAGAVKVKLGERIRFVLINDTMMEHPIHLHGFLFEIENGRGNRLPLKHTINVKPAERMSFVFTADEPGHWAFHCHLLYHMEMGMFRTVLVS